ncbi:MAG: DegV family protein [Acidimicrobiales bacterium]
MIGLVTDSNSQLPARLRDRFAVRVVGLSVVIDGVAYQEGVDLDAETAYRRLGEGATFSTAAPSPGRLGEAYAAAAEAGAGSIVSVHVGSNISATVDAARLAAAAAPVPVEIVDTGTASFAVGCCVWAAGEAIAEGAQAAEAAEAARSVAGRVGNVFVAGALALARRGGRLDEAVTAGGGVAVLALEEGRMREVGRAGDDVEAVAAMADYVLASARPDRALRIGVGAAAAEHLARRLVEALSGPGVAEVVRYQIGPSVVAHTGLGTVGAVFYG